MCSDGPLRFRLNAAAKAASFNARAYLTKLHVAQVCRTYEAGLLRKVIAGQLWLFD